MSRHLMWSLIVVVLFVTGCTGTPAIAPTPTAAPPTDTATPVPTPAVPSSPAQQENVLVRFFRALWEWLTGLFR